MIMRVYIIGSLIVQKSLEMRHRLTLPSKFLDVEMPWGNGRPVPVGSIDRIRFVIIFTRISSRKADRLNLLAVPR